MGYKVSLEQDESVLVSTAMHTGWYYTPENWFKMVDLMLRVLTIIN